MGWLSRSRWRRLHHATTRRINQEHAQWRVRREGWHRSLAERGVTPPADGFWPFSLDAPEEPRMDVRCVYRFADGHRCALVSRHGPKDHVDFECAAIDKVDNDDPRYRSPYGPTGFVREYTDEQYNSFEANAGVIHDHSWLGGEVIHVTNMPGEANFYEKEWFCQFCGVRAQGETKAHATTGRALVAPPVRGDAGSRTTLGTSL